MMTTKKMLPPNPDGMNDDRSAWAQTALAAFRLVTGTDEGDALADLLADLMHWSDRSGFSFAAALDRARCHYEAETTREDPRTFTTEDADRLLQLGDAFLDNWAEDAVQSGERDSEYEERLDEWKTIRSLLVAAPGLLAAAQRIAINCWRYDSAEEYSVAEEDMQTLCVAIAEAMGA